MNRILAYVELDGETRAAGDTYFTFRRNRLTASFSYNREYLTLPGAYPIDPALRLTAGPWPLPQGLPGAFSDAAPDRWGRSLISKRLRAQAAAEERPTPNLDDRDYLLGVSDETRQGALRFKTEIDGEFQHPAPDVPKLIALPALLHAADAVSRDPSHNLDAIKTLQRRRREHPGRRGASPASVCRKFRPYGCPGAGNPQGSHPRRRRLGVRRPPQRDPGGRDRQIPSHVAAHHRGGGRQIEPQAPRGSLIRITNMTFKRHCGQEPDR